MKISSRPILTHSLNSIHSVNEVKIAKKVFSLAMERFEVHVPKKGRWESHRLLRYNGIVRVIDDYVCCGCFNCLRRLLRNEIA